ncbi:CU044_5270 family protein [Thermoactinospora rubra]|uniref:CU044_5270 family protein n=1 Tax=Thermoactinospora rubra TaxID=1088767 RepID=UPI000A118E44|nr:CU044_5270 family protein [Thermoactinospora rubra]
MNEIELFTNERPDPAPYDPGAKAMARDRLVAAARAGQAGARPAWRRPLTLATAGALALAGAFVAAGVLPAETARRPPAATVTQARLMSAAEVLHRAAGAVAEEPAPRDDQYIVVKSQTMYPAFQMGSGKESRYLYRTNRTIWLKAKASTDLREPYGVLTVENLEPKEYPGWPIPEEAHEGVGKSETLPLVNCDGGTMPEHLRTDYAALKRLPADAAGMREHLYAASKDSKSDFRDRAAFGRAGDLLRETYLPPAQRRALYEALATLPGVSVAGDVTDAAGRAGIGVGMEVYDGVRQDLIFDPATFELLGEREVVVDAGKAKAPEGSLLASTAQLEVSVADTAPAAEDGCRKN